jgi:hypothetical protein
MTTALAKGWEPRFPTQDMAYTVAGSREDHFLRDVPRVSNESDYYVMGGVELLEITGDVSCFATRMGFSMDEYLDAFDWDRATRLGIHPGYSLAGCMGIREHFKCWYNNYALPIERAYVGMSLISCVGFQFQEFHWEFNDNLVKRLIDAGTLPEDGPTRDQMVLYLDEDRRLTHWLGMVRESYDAAVDAIAAVGVEALNEYGEEQERKSREAFEAAHQGLIAGERLALTGPKVAMVKQRTRSAIKKGVSMLSALVGPESVRAYISGDGFELQGNLFDYRVSKTVSIIGHTQNTGNGHTPYRLTIKEKDTGTVLGDACVYFKNTPVIDQLIALTFFIRNGEEEQLIKTANIFSRSEAYYDNPIIAELKPNSMRKDLSVLGIPVPGTLGAPNQHVEEIVPWRIRTMNTMMEIMAERTGMPLAYLRNIIRQNNEPATALALADGPWREAG